MGALIVNRGDPDAFAVAIVLAAVAVSALCFAFMLHAGIVIAE